MEYCPYCSEPLIRPAKVCPHCKKSLDLEVVESLYAAGETSELNKKAIRRIWFEEHRHVIIPAITLVIGFVIGALLLYTYSQLQFFSERKSYNNQIAELKAQIKEKEFAVGNVQDDFQKQLQAKDEIIQILAEQQQLMSQIINFTRRLSRNSTITPNSTEQSNYFRRNYLYLNRQFEAQQDKLRATGHEPIRDYNLQTIPQLLQE